MGRNAKATVFFLSSSSDSPAKSILISREGMRSLLSALELLQYNWVTHVIQQELLAQLSLTVLCSWLWQLTYAPPTGFSGDVTSVGSPCQAEPGFLLPSTGADCASRENLFGRKWPSELCCSSCKSAPVALGFAHDCRVCSQGPLAQ